MPVDQKQFLQLIGEWGYDPEALLHKMEELAETANNISDMVGETTYLDIAATCVYALTNDAQKAISLEDIKRPSTGKRAFGGLKARLVSKVLRSALLESSEITMDNYSETVLSRIYDKTSKFTTLEEAVIYLRQSVFKSLAGVTLKYILDVADAVGKSVMELMTCMALAKYQKEAGMATEYYFNPLAARAFDSITEKLVKHKVAMLELPSFINSEFSELTQVITHMFYDGLADRIDALNVKIINAPDMKPHEMAAFRSNYSYAMAVFLIGIAVGYFDYNDYADLMASRKLLQDVVSVEDVEHIERLRNN